MSDPRYSVEACHVLDGWGPDAVVACEAASNTEARVIAGRFNDGEQFREEVRDLRTERDTLRAERDTLRAERDAAQKIVAEQHDNFARMMRERDAAIAQRDRLAEVLRELMFSAGSIANKAADAIALDAQPQAARVPDTVPHPADGFTGWICGNNYRERGRVLSNVGNSGEPWYEAADGTRWSSLDVSFKPDAAPAVCPECGGTTWVPIPDPIDGSLAGCVPCPRCTGQEASK